jgi:hypothetical protein
MPNKASQPDRRKLSCSLQATEKTSRLTPGVAGSVIQIKAALQKK